MRFAGGTVFALAVSLAACSEERTAAPAEATTAAPEAAAPAAEAAGPRAVATLQTAAGAPAGTATATTAVEGEAISLALNLEGLPPGVHGVHVHMTGKCEAPTFESAGSHWNPGNKQHGLDNAQGQHAGDMPNVTIGADGRGTLTYLLKGATFDGLLDGDGSAMVVHAGADDQKTDPSGNSGDRIACGVFGRS
jgi:superoxide dismutase, Cu-Zn family